MIARYCAIITGKAADQTTRSGSNGDDDGGGNSDSVHFCTVLIWCTFTGQIEGERAKMAFF